MPTLIITTPTNPLYDEVTFGVKFQEGRAALNEHSSPNPLGYTLEQLWQKFRTDLPGYEVEFIPDPKPPPPTTAPAAGLTNRTEYKAPPKKSHKKKKAADKPAAATADQPAEAFAA